MCLIQIGDLNKKIVKKEKKIQILVEVLKINYMKILNYIDFFNKW